MVIYPWAEIFKYLFIYQYTIHVPIKLRKYSFIGMIIPNIWKNKNVPNHQPGFFSVHGLKPGPSDRKVTSSLASRLYSSTSVISRTGILVTSSIAMGKNTWGKHGENMASRIGKNLRKHRKTIEKTTKVGFGVSDMQVLKTLFGNLSWLSNSL